MNTNKFEYGIEDLEKASKEFIRMVLHICEAELAKHNDDIKGLSSAAMTIRESILTFLALVNPK